LPKSLPKRIRFTELAISRLRAPPTGEVIYWDSTTPTFGCRVSHTGRKTWTRGKRRLGHYPKMSLKEARARMAGDAPAATTFRELVDGFLEHGRTKRGRPLRQNTIEQYRRLLHGHAKPLHPRRVREIVRADIAALTRKVANENGVAMASLVKAALGRLWTYAIEVGEADSSPVVGSPSYSIGKRTRTLSDVELTAIWHATTPLEAYDMIVRLLLWTGARRGEIGALRWSELVDGELRLPGSRVKNGRPLTLPLPRQALAALQEWPRVVGRDPLFVSTESGFCGWSRAKRELDQRLRFREPFDLHDIRRSVQTRMIGLGIHPYIVNRALNHGGDPISAAYDHHDYSPEVRSALAKWADELDRIVAQYTPQVIPLAPSGRRAAQKDT
jgi:integrase